MSYLSPLRLHFCGRFQASVSTVNNTPQNWDNSTWGANETGQTLGFDPTGDGDWRLIGCKVTAAFGADGAAAAADDPLLRCTVADSDTRVAAKLVDLDSEQQMVSTIFGLQVRIAAADGTTVVSGRFEPAAFTDLWQRWTAGSHDPSFGACFQSVLTDVQWGEGAAGSAVLRALQAATADGMLSIKFNVDGYQTDSTANDYTRGRIAGTIGPYVDGEPRRMLVGRRFLVDPYAFAAKLNYAWAVVDEDAGKLLLDLGNSIPTESYGGALVDAGPLAVTAGDLALGEVSGYGGEDWYAATAGIVALPADRTLDPAELATLAETRLAVTPQGGAPLQEAPMGIYARADDFVFRLDPGETADVRVVASRYGKPYAGAGIVLDFDDSQLQGGDGDPPVGTPQSALSFPEHATTDGAGVATFTLTASDPGNPRGYIDGQVYGVRPMLDGALALGPNYPTNPWDYVSVHVYDAFDVADPQWFPDLQPIFDQYANLYPVMRRIVDLSSYDSVCANRMSLQMAFGLDFEDPNYMPATRDLSKARLAAIMTWLAKDPPPLGAPAVMGTASRTAPADELQPDGPGGKSLAVAKLPAATDAGADR
jgi:hypothetical protein